MNTQKYQRQRRIPVFISLSPRVREAALALAEIESRSMSNLVEHALKIYVSKGQPSSECAEHQRIGHQVEEVA
jgi:hypothetical protein